jgi:hypothetical protein
MDSSKFPRDTDITAAKRLLSSVAQKPEMRAWRIHEQKVCSFSNITSHRNRLLLFVKHLAMRMLKIHQLVTTFNVTEHTLHTQYIQSLMQLKTLFILTLTRHVSAAVGHHQVLLLKLFHCSFYI